MERFFRRFSEILIPKPQYVRDFEAEVTRFLPDLTYGANAEKLLQDADYGILLYHHGPEYSVKPGLYARNVPTGREYVFLEYRFRDDMFHFVGSVDESRQFTFKQLDRSHDRRAYRPVPYQWYRDAMVDATETLKGMEPQGPPDFASG